MPGTVALYARVSTGDQDPQRQVDELEEYAAQSFPDLDTEAYVDIVSGAATERDEYERMWGDISDGSVDTVVVDEISRLSRLGPAAIHEFIQHCLEHSTSIQDREVGLSFDVDDGEVSQAIMQAFAGLMGSLAKIERKQKLRRIESGIQAAQDAGRWTGRPPRGFTVEDGHLRVEVEEFLHTRAALERVAAGGSISQVAEDTGVPTSTLSRLYEERHELYLRGEDDDDRVEAAVEEIQPLPDPQAEPEDWRDEVREIVREEMSSGL